MNTPTHQKTISITLNGQARRLPIGTTLADAAHASGVRPPFAAAINLQFVPRTQYPHTVLNDGDQLELISPVTGG